jgi:hypothetical protein
MKKEEFITLYGRDLKRLYSEIEKYASDDMLWLVLPGTINSGGNICQHLIGNLRTYVGLTLGNFPYIRDRQAEFGKRLFTKSELLEEVSFLSKVITDTLEKLTIEELETDYPRAVLDLFPVQTTRLILVHLSAHLGYHTGQLNYHRRYFTEKENQ